MITLHRGAEGEDGPLYTRITRTAEDGPHAGALFLTAEVYREREPWGAVWPIWRSGDGGRSSALVAEVADERFHAGNRFQPIVYELPRAWGGLDAGTLLLAGNAFPVDRSETNIVLYSSADGAVWEFLCVVDSGGPAEYDPAADATTTAIWEPNLLLVGDELVCFIADERRKADGMLQVIVHRTATDPASWSEPVLDLGIADRFTRPGMFVSTGRMPDGVHRGVFEVVGPREVPIHLVESPDGLDWGDPADLGVRLVATDGTAISGTPNITWAEIGGRVVVIATGRTAIDADGDVVNRGLVSLDGSWESFELPVAASRPLEGDGSGYSQTVLQNAAGELVQATTIRNERGSHDIVVEVAPAPWA